VNTVMNLKVAEKAGDFLTGSATFISSRRTQLRGRSWSVAV
jgi:hypothetical protein